MESIAGRLDHVITVVDLMARQVQALEDDRARAAATERAMRRIAMRLSAAGISMATARAFAAIAAPSRILAATAAGAFAGGLVGTMLWQIWHASAALALP